MESFQPSPLLEGLEQAAKQDIASHFRLRAYKARQHIFYEGDAGDSLYLLKKGQVRIYVSGLDGSETSVIMFGRKGELFGELTLIDRQPRSASAIAVRPSELFTLSRVDFHKLIERYPRLSYNFMCILSERVRYNTRNVDSLVSMDVQQRLARKLLEYAEKYGVKDSAQHTLISPVLRQGDLASLLGTTRESINKSLGTLRQQQIIEVHSGQITILDCAALGAIAT
ncbi:MAG: Crp/Fnr family transcriptional regulator [Candidatus Promineifilaceae bacterium]